jgi:hypothetical protein
MKRGGCTHRGALILHSNEKVRHELETVHIHVDVVKGLCTHNTSLIPDVSLCVVSVGAVTGEGQEDFFTS